MWDLVESNDITMKSKSDEKKSKINLGKFRWSFKRIIIFYSQLLMHSLEHLCFFIFCFCSLWHNAKGLENKLLEYIRAFLNIFFLLSRSSNNSKHHQATSLTKVKFNVNIRFIWNQILWISREKNKSQSLNILLDYDGDWESILINCLGEIETKKLSTTFFLVQKFPTN